MTSTFSTMRLRNLRRAMLFATPGAPYPDTNIVQAVTKDGEIGRMVIESNTKPRRPGSVMYQPPGSIRRVDVLPEYRRQGVATAMWHLAVAAGFDPNHGSRQTDDGKAWSDTIGKHTPPKKHTVASRLMEMWKRSGGREW